MKDMMVDLETLGTVPGCSLLSIGAVRFDTRTGELGEEFYVVINRSSCKDAGLHESDSTVKWWDDRGEEARKVLHEADNPTTSFALRTALGAFNEYIATTPGTRMWGNGADFDNALLRCAYHAVDLHPKLGPFQGRCYRTFKQLEGSPKLTKRVGAYHHALDDAKTQALHMIQVVRHHNLKLG